MNNNENLASQLAANLKENYYLLVEDYTDPLYRYAYTFVQAEAGDVVQEVFILAYIALQGFPKARIMTLAVRPWLYEITRNHCLRKLEKRRRTVVQVPFDEVSIDIPDERLEQAQRQEELLNAIATLPSPYREVLFLRFIEDLKITDIVRRLGKPEGTIKSIISRGKKLLRERLKGLPEKDN